MKLLERAHWRWKVELTRLALQARSDPAALDRSRPLQGLTESSSVLMLCLGNICRSPMAERYLERRLEERGLPIDVRSSGFVEQEGRPSPESAVRAAREFGVDLSDHRSRIVSPDELARSDVVFVMDAGNYRRLGETFPHREPRVSFLGVFGDGDFEIRDPHGGDFPEFREVYHRIASAVDGFVDALDDIA